MNSKHSIINSIDLSDKVDTLDEPIRNIQGSSHVVRLRGKNEPKMETIKNSEYLNSTIKLNNLKEMINGNDKDIEKK